MANVLLLEPDTILARTYMQGLQHVGHDVRTCRDGQAAVQLLDTFTADIIVMELQLTGHGGVEFLHELRSYPEWQQLPVIINTSVTPQALAPLREALARDAGVAVCLYKPRTSLQQLIRLVNEQVRATA
jgi:DNA-binding response OmpR family regulator